MQAPEQARSCQLQLTPAYGGRLVSSLNTQLVPATHASSVTFFLPVCLSHPGLNDDTGHVALSVAPAHALNGQHFALEGRELAAAPHAVLRVGQLQLIETAC